MSDGIKVVKNIIGLKKGLVSNLTQIIRISDLSFIISSEKILQIHNKVNNDKR